jgi:hypothetical protein
MSWIRIQIQIQQITALQLTHLKGKLLTLDRPSNIKEEKETKEKQILTKHLKYLKTEPYRLQSVDSIGSANSLIAYNRTDEEDEAAGPNERIRTFTEVASSHTKNFTAEDTARGSKTVSFRTQKLQKTNVRAKLHGIATETRGEKDRES